MRNITSKLFMGGAGANKLKVITATGGSVTDYDKYRIHRFTTNGTFSVSYADPGAQIELIMVGGGGGGSKSNSSSELPGGGGAGALYWNPKFSLSAGTYNIVIGSGGPAGNTASGSSTRGGNTTAFGITAWGGGPASTNDGNLGAFGNFSASLPGDGGSGGARMARSSSVFVNHPQTGVGNTDQGQTVVSGLEYFYGNKSGSPVTGASAGGGGAGGPGGNGQVQYYPEFGFTVYSMGPGGEGLGFNLTGTTEYFAGGGGGARATASSNFGGSGGSGVGGNGGGGFDPGVAASASSPVANTGSGGGSSTYGSATAGAAGIVIIRYRII